MVLHLQIYLNKVSSTNTFARRGQLGGFWFQAKHLFSLVSTQNDSMKTHEALVFKKTRLILFIILNQTIQSSGQKATKNTIIKKGFA